MLTQEQNAQYPELDGVLAQAKQEPGSLISVLHAAQEAYGYLSDEVMEFVAKSLGLPLSQVSGVVSFYAFFNRTKKGKYAISICLGTACHVKGADNVLEACKEHLGIDAGETTEDEMYTLEVCHCVGTCSLAPVLTINGEVHGKVKADDVPALLDGLMAQEG